MKFDNVIAKRKNKVIVRNNEDCIKIFDNEFNKTDVLNEALNQARIEGLGLNIPHIKEVMMIDGKWSIVSEYIEGKTLDVIMDSDKDNLKKHLERFVDIQLEIQSKRCPYLYKIKDKMSLKITNSEIDENIKYELLTRLNSMPKHEKVCHGDFNPTNIIITDNDEAYVLDWSHVTQGNASADAARTYLLFSLDKKDKIANMYLDLFCKKSNIEKRNVQRWMPIVAASQLTKAKPEEKEFLQKWINVVEYE